jgi:hypothetical protein
MNAICFVADCRDLGACGCDSVRECGPPRVILSVVTSFGMESKEFY